MDKLKPAQTWQMLCPPEPGDEVTCVRDRDGSLWDRVGNNMWRLRYGSWWLRYKDSRASSFQFSWPNLVRFQGPLQDATTPDSGASAATRPTPANVPPAQPRGSAR